MSRVCSYWARGHCRFGEDCRFLHDYADDAGSYQNQGSYQDYASSDFGLDYAAYEGYEEEEEDAGHFSLGHVVVDARKGSLGRQVSFPGQGGGGQRWEPSGGHDPYRWVAPHLRDQESHASSAPGQSVMKRLGAPKSSVMDRMGPAPASSVDFSFAAPAQATGRPTSPDRRVLASPGSPSRGQQRSLYEPPHHRPQGQPQPRPLFAQPRPLFTPLQPLFAQPRQPMAQPPRPLMGGPRGPLSQPAQRSKPSPADFSFSASPPKGGTTQPKAGGAKPKAGGGKAAEEKRKRSIYSTVEELSEEELAAFKAQAFTLHSVPLRPPPRELC